MQMSDEELNEKFRKYIYEEVVEQELWQEHMCEFIENLMTQWDTSHHRKVSIMDTTHKLDRMARSFKVKHRMRPHDSLSFLSIPYRAKRLKKMAFSAKEFYLPPHFFLNRRLNSNTHGIILSKTSKVTLKPH